MDCLFCKIQNGEIPCNKIYEDELMIAFHDISKQAPEHFLVIPKVHIASANDINEENSNIIAKIFVQIPNICKVLGVENGYRIVNNCGDDGGQTVSHLHFHVLAKRNLSWPPG